MMVRHLSVAALAAAILVMLVVVPAAARPPRSFPLPGKGFHLLVEYLDYDLSDDGERLVVLQWTRLMTRVACAFQAFTLRVIDLSTRQVGPPVLVTDGGWGKAFDPEYPTHVAWRGPRAVVLGAGAVRNGIASCPLYEYDLSQDGDPVRIDEIGSNAQSGQTRFFDFTPDGSTLLFFRFRPDRWHRDLIARTGGAETVLVENRVMSMVRARPDGSLWIGTPNPVTAFLADAQGGTMQTLIRKGSAGGAQDPGTDYWCLPLGESGENFVRRFPATDKTYGFLATEYPEGFPVPLLSYRRHDLYIGRDGAWENLTGGLPPSFGGVVHQPLPAPPKHPASEMPAP